MAASIESLSELVDVLSTQVNLLSNDTEPLVKEVDEKLEEHLAKAVEKLASDHHAVLLANHGPVVAGQSLEEAVFATEELEETAKLYLLTKDMEQAPLTDEQVAEIKRRYPIRC